jgi:hypothetical protein
MGERERKREKKIAFPLKGRIKEHQQKDTWSEEIEIFIP